MADVQWYYSRDGAQLGPVAGEELRRMAHSGELPPAALVWRDGMPQWQPAWQATGFFPPPATAVPPPLPPRGPAPVGYANPYGYGGLSPGIGSDPAMRMLLPVGRSPWAIAAGYLGLVSVILVPAPVALVVSLIAISDVRKNPSKHGMGRAVFGLVMGIIFTLILAFAVLTSIAAWP